MNRSTGFLVLALLCASPGLVPHADAVAAVSVDTRILGQASIQLGHAAPRAVLSWLRLQPTVQSASVGVDHRTVNLQFQDGMQAAILPRTQRDVALPTFRRFARAATPGRASVAPQAAVWEPFASELGLGPNAGDVEVQQLQAAGFAVDQKYDTSVTVAHMASLSSYNIVYMHTHSGVSASGDGVVATGEPANGDPAVAPLLQDGSVMTVGVAGSSQQYYAITSKYVALHEGTFPANSLLFLNGCALLRATTFWQALHARGAATLVSWDQNAAAKDDYLSAAAFFNVMGEGKTVAAAIATLRAGGYGTSSDQGVLATLGYVGDGAITLGSAAAAGGGMPAPPPTSTAVPTATAARPPPPDATATSVPVVMSTSTPVPTHPPVPALVALLPVVKPGAVQQVSVSNLAPVTPVQLRVTFPDGEVSRSRVDSDSTGRAQFSFVQLSSKLTRHSRTATVEVTATTASGTATMTVHYTIGYGNLDLVVNPRTLSVGGHKSVLIHTLPRTRVTLRIRAANGKAATIHGTTGTLGWVKLQFVLRQLNLGVHRGQTLAIRATVRLHGKGARTSTTLTVS